MKLDEKMVRVIADLEYQIGSECYNPNSYDGWNDIEGCEYRYPISYPNKEGKYTKTRLNINEYNRLGFIDSSDITSKTIPFMKYKFGSNELMIGKGLINCLNYLENRYGISFNELEKNVKNSQE